MKTIKQTPFSGDGRAKVRIGTVEWDAILVMAYGTVEDFLKVFEPHPNYAELKPAEKTKTLKAVYAECDRVTKPKKIEAKPKQ